MKDLPARISAYKKMADEILRDVQAEELAERHGETVGKKLADWGSKQDLTEWFEAVLKALRGESAAERAVRRIKEEWDECEDRSIFDEAVMGILETEGL